MLGTSFVAALISAIQELFIGGILGWITEFFSAIFPQG